MVILPWCSSKDQDPVIISPLRTLQYTPPSLNMCRRIVDLVSTGKTLKEKSSSNLKFIDKNIEDNCDNKKDDDKFVDGNDDNAGNNLSEQEPEKEESEVQMVNEMPQQNG